MAGEMPDVLIHGDTVRDPAMRHEIPLMVPDPFLYAEAGDERHVVVSSLERSRIEAVDSASMSTHSRSSATTIWCLRARTAGTRCSRYWCAPPGHSG